MDALQLCQRLKTIDQHFRFICLTALDAAEELLSVLDVVRAVDVMKKPIERKYFIQRIRTSIRKLSGARDRNAT